MTTCLQTSHAHLTALPTPPRWLKSETLKERVICHNHLLVVAEHGADSVYKNHSGSIVETSEGLKAKAESQMAEARQIEVTASHNFQMRQQFLEDELKFNAQDLEAAKHSLGEAQGQLTADTADLKMTADALAEDAVTLEDAKQDCQAKAVEFEASVKNRSEELEALAKAQTVISEKTGGAESFSYGLIQTSFLQLSRSVLSPRGGLAKFEAVRKTRELAKSEHSLELAQLASRVASAMHGDVNTHVQHVVHTVEVERPRIIKQTVQEPIIQEKILLQFINKVIENPIVVQTVQKTIEISQLQDIGEVVDVPVVLVAQVPRVKVVEEAVETPQLQIVKKTIEIPEIRMVRGTQTSESLGTARTGQLAQETEVYRDEACCMQQQMQQQAQQQKQQQEQRQKQQDAEQQHQKPAAPDKAVMNVQRGDSRTFQIFVKTDDLKTMTMDVTPNDKIQDVVRRGMGYSKHDVYVTCEGRMLNENAELKSSEVRDGSTVRVVSRLRGGGKHKDKKSKVKKEQVTRQEPVRSGGPAILESEKEAVIRVWEETEEYRTIVENVSGGSDMDMERKMRHWASKLQERPGGDIMECGLRWAVEARRKKRGEEKREQEQEEQEQVPGQEQGKKVCLGEEEEPLEETRAKNTDEPEVTGRVADARTGPGSASLVRGGDARHWADESNRKGKGKGNGGKGEHGSKGGTGSKGTQQVENFVMDEDQGNTGVMRREEDQENHREDVRKLVEMMQKEEVEQEEAADGEQQHSKEKGEGGESEEDGRGRVAPNMGAGGSHPQATSDPRKEEKKKNETRVLSWADCNYEEGKENEEEVEEEKETGQWEMMDERPPGLEEVESEPKMQEEEEPSQVENEQEAREEERRAQEAQEQKRAQKAREEEQRMARETREKEEQKRAREAREEEEKAQEMKREKRVQEAREKEVKAQGEQEREASVHEERERQAREARAQEEREKEVSAQEELVEAQEGHEGEEAMTTQDKCVEEQKETNSMHEENHVSNRHMTWWQRSWWVRLDNGSHLRTARGRRRAWRAATRAARDTCDTERTEEVQKSANSGGEWFSREELLSARAAVQQQQPQPQQQSKQQQLQVLHDLVRCMQTVLEYADRQ